MATSVTEPLADLGSFVPRLTLDWLRDRPERLWTEVDGTLAFVDISGFTAMSEQLSSRGKAGAEEVTDVMNATFAALLQVAYEEGGGLLKFGGDALLLLFDGDGHAQRAARATFGMRRVLRAIGRPRTSAGPVQLRMHAGIHSGLFQFFLVGASHRELIVSGPAATRTVEMEAASEAGEILVSPETAALLDPSTVGDEKGPGLLLAGEPEGGGEPAPLPDLTGVPIEVAVPEPLRAQLLEVGPLEGEHRNGAIAFVRFSGIDEVVRTEGADAVAEGLAALVEALQSAAAEHHVTFLESDVDRDGGRIVLVAGAPQTFGDDEDRLLRTLHAAIESGLPFPVHVGVNRGRFFTGQVGASFRRTYTLLGDTAALAARLMARAGSDEIWVAADAYARGGGHFEATELEPFHVKGKAEPVHAVVLGGLEAAPADLPSRDPGGRPEVPFVDRERERAVLGAAVAPVRLGFGTLVELIGEPGIGKSRLAENLQDQCADMVKVGARCDQYESTTPYFPFRPLLRSLLGVELTSDGEENRRIVGLRMAELDPELAPWAPLLAAPLDVEMASTPEVDDLDPAFWRARLHGVMSRLLGELLAEPTLLMFEDVHWMDDASSELLRYLGTQLPSRPWLACTTRRPGDGGFAAAEGTPPLPALSLRLEPIPEEDAKTLVRAAAGGRELSDVELAALMERGAGNPLFLQELAASDDAADGSDELPQTVQALVATRIDKLGPADRALLRWASVLGAEFDGALIAEVLEHEAEVEAGSEAWARLAEFVELNPDVPGGFRFRHALIRDAAYEGLSFRRRRDLHGRVADVIERREGADASELLSLHFQRAERWPEAWRYSVAAGRRAWEKCANVESAQFFQRALLLAEEAAPPAGEVASIWDALGDARMRLGEYEAAEAAFFAARNIVGDDLLERGRLMQKEAVARLRRGQYPDALDRLGEALQVVEGIDGSPAAQLHARLSSWCATVMQYQKRSEEAIEWCERTIPAAKRAGAREALAQAYFILDWANVSLGRIDRAVHSQLAIPIYEELGNYDRVAIVLNNLGQYAYIEGRWGEALEHTYRARESWKKIGDHTSATLAEFNLAEILAFQGRLEEAEALLRDALRLQQSTGNAVFAAHTTSALGRIAALEGRFDESRELLGDALAVYRREQDEVESFATETKLVECLVLEENGDEAVAGATELLQRAETIAGVSSQVVTLHRLLGIAQLETGALDAARAAIEESVRLASVHDANFGANRSLDYDHALALDALIHARALSGEEVAHLAEERDAILARLNVSALPAYPVVYPPQ